MIGSVPSVIRVKRKRDEPVLPSFVLASKRPSLLTSLQQATITGDDLQQPPEQAAAAGAQQPPPAAAHAASGAAQATSKTRFRFTGTVSTRHGGGGGASCSNSSSCSNLTTATMSTTVITGTAAQQVAAAREASVLKQQSDARHRAVSIRRSTSTDASGRLQQVLELRRCSSVSALDGMAKAPPPPPKLRPFGPPLPPMPRAAPRPTMGDAALLEDIWRDAAAASEMMAAEEAAMKTPERGASATSAAAAAADDGDEDEDAFSDRADDFERAHNFRYEEGGAGSVAGHPRHDASSVRRQTALGRKKEAEAGRKARKAEARAQKELELRRLKNLKKQEILSRLQTIQKVSGGAAALSEVDLSGDFDPEAWDQRMAQVFDEQYYDDADDGFVAAGDAADGGEGDGWGAHPYGYDGYYDADEAIERDLAAAGAGGGGGANGGGGAASSSASGFEALTKKLRESKSETTKRTVQQYMDEYYALDYEDVLGEGEDALPTRFKYRAVEPAGFGVGRQPLPPHQPPARCPWECPSLPCPLPSGSDGPPPTAAQLTDRELLELDDKELGKIVPTRLVKRPYAQWDAARVKSRAKRVRWEAEAARRAEEGSAGGPGKRGGRLAERPAGDERREKIKRPREAPETTPAAQAQTSTKVAAASRLEAFAKVNKRSKREAREARKERKKKGTF